MPYLKAIIVFLLMTMSLMPVSAAYIFRSDGTILDSKIISQTATSIRIRSDSGKIITIKGSDILRIREILNIRKDVSIYSDDSKTFITTNVVDESSRYYVCRKDIASPSEDFIDKKKSVLFSHSLDSELSVDSGLQSVTVAWQGSADFVRYQLYVDQGEGTYVLMYGGSETHAAIKGLPGNRRCRVVLCAFTVYGEGFGPSHAVEFVTRNNPPSVPQGLICSELVGDNTSSLLLSWKNSTDTDGKVKKYRIYQKTGREYSLMGESEKNEWIIPDYERAEILRFAVSAVDDHNAESEKSKDVVSRKYSSCAWLLGPQYSYPLGALHKNYSYSYGGILFVEKKDVFTENFSLGLGAGLLAFRGSHGSQGDLFPFVLGGSCSFPISGVLDLYARLMAGPAYYGGKIEGKSFSKFALMGQLTPGVRAHVGSRLDIEMNPVVGTFYSSKTFNFYTGFSLALALLISL